MRPLSQCRPGSLRFAVIWFYNRIQFTRLCGPVDSDGNLLLLRFGRVYLARSFKCSRELDAEVAPDRRARLRRVV